MTTYTSNFLNLARQLRTLRLKAHAATARFELDVVQVRKEVNRGAITEKGFVERTESFRQRALVDATHIRDQVGDMAETADRIFTTHGSLFAEMARTPLEGRKGYDGKYDLAGYLERLPEDQFAAEVQRMIDNRDLGALGVVLNVKPEVRSEVLPAIRGEYPEIEEREAAVASALLDAAEINELCAGLQSGKRDERKTLKVWAQRQDLLDGRFNHVGEGELEKAGMPNDTGDLNEQNKAKAEIAECEAAMQTAAERVGPPSGKATLAAAMPVDEALKVTARQITSPEDFVPTKKHLDDAAASGS